MNVLGTEELLKCVRMDQEPNPDSSERYVIKLLSYQLDQSKDQVKSEYINAKLSFQKWLDGLPSNHAPIQAHLFYVNYSAILHLGAACSELENLLELRPKDKHPFNSVNRRFFSCATQCFSALDLIGHISYLRQSGDIMNMIVSPKTWDFTKPRGYKTLDVLKGDHERVLICEESFKLKKLKDLFRNKPVHRLFNYVVRRRKGLIDECDIGNNTTLAILNPDMSTKSLCIARSRVIQEKEKPTLPKPYYAWDILPSKYFLRCSNCSKHGIIPADNFLKSILLHSWLTYLDVSAYKEKS